MTKFIDDDTMQHYRDLVKSDSLAARKYIKKMNYKGDAYLLRCIAITYRDEAIPEDRNRKFNCQKIALAKKYIDLAFIINPLCRDVLFAKGTIYNSLGLWFDAVTCYTAILAMGLKLTPDFNCAGGDLEYVRMVRNDCYLKLHQIFYENSSLVTARNLLKKFKRGLRSGIETIYHPIDHYIYK
jgi:hypothetical protein